MARAPRNSNLSSRRLRSSPSTVPCYYKKAKKAAKENELQSTSEEKDWKHATCPICLERPHDAVLLLCSSHNKGCRPYMCGTNYHQSNCLEQFKNAYVKEKRPAHEVSTAVATASKRPNDLELACPICRGEVKGWTLVEQARQFLNRKRRTCSHEDCSFIGSYKKLCKHVEAKHPSSKPREVDPARLAEWKELESKKERQDAISIVTGLNPGFIIRGDYLIDPNGDSSDLDMGYSDWSDSSDSFLICDDDDDIDDYDEDDDDEDEDGDDDDDDDIILPEGAGIRALRRAVRRAYSRKNAARARQHVRIVGVRSSGIPRSGLTISRSSGRRRGVTNHRKVRVGSAWRRARSTNDS